MVLIPKCSCGGLYVLMMAERAIAEAKRGARIAYRVITKEDERLIERIEKSRIRIKCSSCGDRAVVADENGIGIRCICDEAMVVRPSAQERSWIEQKCFCGSCQTEFDVRKMLEIELAFVWREVNGSMTRSVISSRRTIERSVR